MIFFDCLFRRYAAITLDYAAATEDMLPIF